ncbi:MAG TPA: DUF2341 domain-containing protein, partial [Candidatus Woesebacteria bacterium]|nr:DUF2341 domain-containing protein [Candidatus Woesebacteria bacterium]
PGPADQMNFDADCDNSAVWDSDATATVTTFNLNTGYSGTVTLARSLAVNSTMTVNDGIFTASNQTLAVTSTFTLNTGGTFIASSETTTFTFTFTINGGTFNHNNGTVIFNGSTATLSCNNITFNLVILAGTAGTKTINSNCFFPLGANPSIISGGSYTLNGTLSGSGAFTKSGNTVTLNTGSSLVGFSDLSVNGLVIAGANMNFNTYSSFTAASTVTLSLGSLSLPNNADLNGELNISGGTFNTPSGIMTVAGSLTISGSPTFNANGGTVTFDGGSQTLNCNNIELNFAIFSGSGTKTVMTNCSIPLGNNPTIPTGFNITLNGGRLTGSGTLTKSGNIINIQNGGNLSGFTGLIVQSLTISAASTDTILDLSTYTVVDINGAFTLNAPTNPYTNTFIAPSGTITVAGNLTINGGTFIANNGTIIFDGSSGTLTCNNAVFNLVIFQQTSQKVVNSDCNLPLGNNPTISSGLSINGSLTGSGTLSQTNGNFTLNVGSSISGFNNLDVYNLNISGTTLDLSTYTSAIVKNAFNLNSGTIIAPSTMTIRGSFFNSGGTFNHNNGTIVFEGLNRVINGSTTFYNFTKTATSSDSLIFQSGETQTIEGTLTLQGVQGSTLALIGSTANSQWNIDPQGARDIEYVDVKDSNNIHATVITAGAGSYDSGNNTGWTNLIFGGSGDGLSSSTGIHESSSKEDWWNYSWAYRKQLFFDNTNSNLGTTSETLTDFPVLVKLTQNNFNFNEAKNDGSDIRFLDADNKTPLSYEIEKWDKDSKQAFIWVKVPQIERDSNSDSMFFYYGNPQATDSQNVTGTWNANYAGVWHLKEQGITTYDSTSNENHGTKVSSTHPQYTSSGQIDGAQNFNGVSDYIDLGDNSSLETSNQITISMWVNLSTFGIGNGVNLIPILSKRGGDYSSGAFSITERDGSILTSYSDGTTSSRLEVQHNFELDKSYYISSTFNNGRVNLYTNGI